MRSMRLVRESFSDKRRTTAIAVYQALTECASEEGRRKRRSVATFPAPLARLAAKAGKSVNTIKRYVEIFRTLGLITWETRRQGKMNIANLWTLLAPSAHNGGGTSPHNNELVHEAHNSEPAREEKRRMPKTKKEGLYRFKNTDEVESAGEIIRRQYQV